MNLPKFIITLDGVFRLGMVNQHKHLLKPGDQCIGGGYYVFDFVSNRIILDRESYDFGKPKWHLLDTLKVPSTYRGMRIVYKYDDGFHDDFKAAVKREQSDACISSAEREQFRTDSKLRLSESRAMLASALPSVSSFERSSMSVRN